MNEPSDFGRRTGVGLVVCVRGDEGVGDARLASNEGDGVALLVAQVENLRKPVKKSGLGAMKNMPQGEVSHAPCIYQIGMASQMRFSVDGCTAVKTYS